MRTLLVISVLLATTSFVSTVQAQFEQQQRIQSYRAGFRNTNSTILNRPTVSPYLALADLNGVGVDTSQNYFTQVRPRLERRAAQQQQQRQLQVIQRDMSALRSASARQSQPGQRATGHPTRFGTYLQYYPGLGRR